MADKWLAGLIHAIKEFDEALFLCFRNGLSDGFAYHIAMANEFVIGRIHQFEPVVGSAEGGEKRRSLLEQLRKALVSSSN